MELFQQFFEFILKYIPKDPFKDVISNISVPDYVGVLNWFIPVSQILSVFSIWLTALAAYYLISVVLRKTGVIS